MARVLKTCILQKWRGLRPSLRCLSATDEALFPASYHRRTIAVQTSTTRRPIYGCASAVIVRRRTNGKSISPVDARISRLAISATAHLWQVD